MWDPQFMSTKDTTNSDITIEAMKKLEDSYDSDKMETFCNKHNLPFREAKWQTSSY